MPQCDKRGRQYLKISEAYTGQRIIVDGDLPCMDGYETARLAYDPRFRDFYFICEKGQHYLSGQDVGDGYAYGIYPLRKDQSNA